MNKHIFLDTMTASLGSLVAGKKKFFVKSIQSSSFEEHIAATQIDCPQITGEGIFEIKAKTLVGELNPALGIAKWIGFDCPTIIYHHGNNERPFDYTNFAKNSFYKILAKHKLQIQANLLVVRAPFHNCKLSFYQEKMTELANFVAMISTSVKFNETIVQYMQSKSKAPVITAGISLGGWTTNIHRGIFNSSSAYIPFMAGTLLGDLFLNSKYRKLTSDIALQNPEQIKSILNFDKYFVTIKNKNLFPLLGRYDQFIEYNFQKESYNGHPLKTIDYGHITGSLQTKTLKNHILDVLNTLQT